MTTWSVAPQGGARAGQWPSGRGRPLVFAPPASSEGGLTQSFKTNPGLSHWVSVEHLGGEISQGLQHQQEPSRGSGAVILSPSQSLWDSILQIQKMPWGVMN